MDAPDEDLTSAFIACYLASQEHGSRDRRRFEERAVVIGNQYGVSPQTVRRVLAMGEIEIRCLVTGASPRGARQASGG
jgi:hypothetical protein